MACAVNVLFAESRLTNDYKRFALLATTPLFFCVSLVSPCSTTYLALFELPFQFFSLSVVGNITYV